MNSLFELLCIPKGPSLTQDDLKSNNYNAFIEKTMKSSGSLFKDHDLQDEAKSHLSKLVAGKSSSASNTMKMIKQLFDTASKNAKFDHERALLVWLETCVMTTISSAFQEEVVSEKPPTTASKKQKTSSNKKKQASETDEEEDYDRLGDSDDDYVPSDTDAMVPNGPTKTTTKKKTKKTSSDNDQEVPIIPEGAGTKEVVKYFTGITTASASDIMPKGYFVKSYFFPSKESFNAFLSVLNSAQTTIDICVFAFTDDDVANALIAAKKRKVKIRIITDNQQAAGKGADAKRLHESYGIPFKTDHTQGYMHNKFAIIDSSVLINGSFNWSKGARFKNRENILITNVPLCIKEFQTQWDSLWEEF
ncbi:phospholipase D/nuclease [Backusella circina FSU 941]|nr:phospholipase D/nuclease [Backusella circina FSU 941]KAI8883711.1 phospholipase D/nuclease [Backusella circina FSU 941]